MFNLRKYQFIKFVYNKYINLSIISIIILNIIVHNIGFNSKLEISLIIFDILQFQTSATVDLLNKCSYLTCDIEIREIVSFKIIK